MSPQWVFLGSIFMFLSVAIGAFGAHAVKTRLTPEMLAIFEVGVRYQVYHALGLFVDRLDGAANGGSARPNVR